MGPNQPRALLVAGASGQLGRRVVELLLDAGAGPLIATTRTPQHLAAFSARGVTVRRADYEDPASLDAAFRGAGRMLLVSTDALDHPGKRLSHHRAAIDAAVREGAQHVVYTSISNPDADSKFALAVDHRGTEEALRASGAGYTLLRNNLYADAQLVRLKAALQTGTLTSAAGEGKVAYVTREDCARAAAAALASGEHDGEVMDITGPRAISQPELARLASRIAARPLAHVPIDAARARADMERDGVPAHAAAIFASYDEAIAQGKFDCVSPCVEVLTGRGPEDLETFLARSRERWT